MATRRDIREAFYSHLETAVGAGTASELVTANNIGEEQPESEEDYPAIVHRDDWRKIYINDGSSAPTELIRDSNGNVTTEVYETFHEGSFGVGMLDPDESHREDVYEAVRSYFEKYEERPWDESNIQADVEWVNVLDADSRDDPDAMPTIRGDRLIIRLGFSRAHTRDVDPMTTVSTDVDADNDGTTDETYTFSS